MSALELAWETVVRDPEIKEPSQDSISGAEMGRSAIFDEGYWSIAGQEMEDSRATVTPAKPMTGGEGALTSTSKEQEAESLACHRPWEEGIKIVVSDEQEARRCWEQFSEGQSQSRSLQAWEHEQEKELPKPELEDRGNGNRDTAGCKPGSHINHDAAAMSKQEHVNDCVRGGDEDG